MTQIIKILKIGETIYYGYPTQTEQPDGTIVKNIPDNVDDFKVIVVDTLNWWVGSKIKSQMQNDFTKLSAANSKAIALIFKALKTLNPDTSNFTDTEKSIWNKLDTLTKTDYTDSKLLDNTLTAVTTYIQEGNDLINKALQATTIDELIGILNELEV